MRLQQVFWNVLRNAVHFTPEDGRIIVETRSDGAAGDFTLAVTDTGIGIEPEDVGRIFAAFEQGDVVPGAARRSGGLGLGLAICRTLVEVHRGSIHATSPGRGGGSTFVVKLPRLEGAAPPTEPGPVLPPVPDDRTRMAAAEASDVVRGCVLIVEDHAPTRKTLQRLFERRNFAVLTAGSLAEARAEVGPIAIDLLISDIGLPDGDGHALMVELRAAQPALHGIALSGHGTAADIARSRAAGFDAHLTKPVTVASLDQAIQCVGALEPCQPGMSATAGCFRP